MGGPSNEDRPCPYDHFFVSKLVCKWSGSLWQLLRADIAMYIVMYIALATVYISVMAVSPESRVTFESIAHWLQQVRSSTPLSFLLGFYVATVIGRWWSAISAVPYVQGAACKILSLVTPPSAGDIELTRRFRSSIIRYLNLAWLMTMCDISEAVRYRISREIRPDPDDCQRPCLHDGLPWQLLARGANRYRLVRSTFGQLVVQADLDEAEAVRLRQIPVVQAEVYKPPSWFPQVRALQLLQQAWQAGFIKSERSYVELVRALNDYFGSVGTMYMFAMYKIPLVYTQVVIIAVYTYVSTGLLATQLLDENMTGVGFFSKTGEIVPIFEHPRLLLHFFPLGGLLEFVFYIGWFKIGMVLLEPFGREVADIPLVEVLDYNLVSSYSIAGHPSFDSADLLSELERTKSDCTDNIGKVSVGKFFQWLPPVPDTLTDTQPPEETEPNEFVSFV